MRRKQALALITADAFENGKASDIGLRVYLENHISLQAFSQAVRLGQQLLKQHKGAQSAESKATK